MLAGNSVAESTYTGQGEVQLAPEIWGDVFPLHITHSGAPWFLGHSAYLAATGGVNRSIQRQSIGKMLCEFHIEYAL